VSLGIRNPESNDKEIILSKIEFDVGANGLTQYSIDHGSYTPGTQLDVLNRKPSLQEESPIEAEVTLNPTVSNPQLTTNGFVPGGTKTSGSGTTTERGTFVLSPGQDLVMQLTNISGGDNYYGFTLGIVEKFI
jgi:hypothetical protein